MAATNTLGVITVTRRRTSSNAAAIPGFARSDRHPGDVGGAVTKVVVHAPPEQLCMGYPQAAQPGYYRSLVARDPDESAAGPAAANWTRTNNPAAGDARALVSATSTGPTQFGRNAANSG